MDPLATRLKSPKREDAIMMALRPRPTYSSGVLIGNWVEDRIDCPSTGTFYFPPKDDTDTSTLKPESRQPDFCLNKLSNIQGNINSVIHHDSHDWCQNYSTTNSVFYDHLPKPLCGPMKRYYKKGEHQYYPQPDLLKCYGNITEWGLRKYKEHEWRCEDVSDYAATLYEDTFVAPMPDQYLDRCERKARDSSFTKSFRFKMTKPLKKPKKT